MCLTRKTNTGKILCTKHYKGKNELIIIDTPADLMRKLNWEYRKLELEGLVTSVDNQLLECYREYYAEYTCNDDYYE